MAKRTSYIKCTRSDKTSTFEGGLQINGNFTFGDASADTFTCTGAAEFDSTVALADATTVATDKKVIFRAATQYLNSSAASTLDIVGPTTNITASTLAGIYSPDIRVGYDTGAYMKTAVTDATGVTAVTFAGSGATYTMTVPTFTVVASSGIKLDGTVTLDDDGTIADASDIMTLTQDTITLAGATKINLDGPTDVSGAVVLDSSETTGLSMTGTYTNGIDLTGATLTQGLDNALFSIGSVSNAKSVSLTDSYIPMQVFISATADTGSGTLAAEYLKVENTTDIATLQLCGSLLRVELNGAADSAYGLQSHIGTQAAVSGIDNVAAVSGKIDMDNDITTSYTVQAGLFVMEGTGTITGNSTCIHGEVENGTTIDDMMILNGTGTATNIFNVSGTNRTNFIYSSAAAGPIGTVRGTPNQTATCDGSLKVLIGSDTLYIPLYNAVTVS